MWPCASVGWSESVAAVQPFCPCRKQKTGCSECNCPGKQPDSLYKQSASRDRKHATRVFGQEVENQTALNVSNGQCLKVEIIKHTGAGSGKRWPFLLSVQRLDFYTCIHLFYESFPAAILFPLFSPTKS